jgi:hypothetical protein
LLWPALATLGGSGSQARDVRVQALDDDEAAPADRYGFEFTFSEQLPHFVLPNVPKLGSGARNWHEQGSDVCHWSVAHSAASLVSSAA